MDKFRIVEGTGITEWNGLIHVYRVQVFNKNNEWIEVHAFSDKKKAKNLLDKLNGD